MHDGDLNLIHFNKDNYTCCSCHDHQGVVALRCKFHSCLVHVNAKIRRKNKNEYPLLDLGFLEEQQRKLTPSLCGRFCVKACYSQLCVVAGLI